MKRFNLLLAAAALSLMNAGCSVFPEPATVHLLDPAPGLEPGSRTPVDASLSIALPATDPARDSAQLLVRSDDGRLLSYPQTRWVAPVPELFQSRLVRVLRDGALLRDVDRGQAGRDLIALFDLRRFELDAGGPLRAVIELDARLLHGYDHRVLGHWHFNAVEALEGEGPAAINAAFERLFETLAVEMTEWIARTVDSD
ncbi:MAG: hypothetical protein Kow0020_08550 [Wenzhouxiangellaceae bacterium]